MFRSYTHESIKNFDWTTPRDTYEPEIDGDPIDTERIAAMIRVFGRQFDDLKRYIENIKYTTNITYDSKNNMSDKGLGKFLEMNGWEVKNAAPVVDNDVLCRIEYPGKTVKASPEDANIEFLRRMILNSRNILSKKGTKAGIKTVYSLFGIDESAYTISEYTTTAQQFPSGEAYDEIMMMNMRKDNFENLYNRTLDNLVGLVGATIEYEGINYLVPWYDPTLPYDADIYYQMYGGWGKRHSKKINLDIAPGVKRLNATSTFSIYDETIKNIKIADNFDELSTIPVDELSAGDVYYVYDITGAYMLNGCDEDELEKYSHYCILEEVNTNGTSSYDSMPYNDDYAWRLVKNEELANPVEDYAKRIVYLESINDFSIGNNPHDGKKYDDGKAYFETMNYVFGGAYEKGLFENYSQQIRSENAKRNYENRFRSEPIEDIPDLATEDYLLSEDFSFKINPSLTEDNVKIYYFINGESELLTNTPVLYKEDPAITNQNIQNNVFVWDMGYISPFTHVVEVSDFEDSNLQVPSTIENITGYKQHDLSSYSILNTKNVKITYHLSRHYEDYVTDVVEYYVKQIIPSTCIVEFVWDYTDMPTDGNGCYTDNYGMVSDDERIFAGVSAE